MAKVAGKKQIMTYKAHQATSGEGSKRIKEMLHVGGRMGVRGLHPCHGVQRMPLSDYSLRSAADQRHTERGGRAWVCAHMRLVLHLRGASEPPVLPTLPTKMLWAAIDKERRSEKKASYFRT